jgi:hypothetical protein
MGREKGQKRSGATSPDRSLLPEGRLRGLDDALEIPDSIEQASIVEESMIHSDIEAAVGAGMEKMVRWGLFFNTKAEGFCTWTAGARRKR